MVVNDVHSKLNPTRPAAVRCVDLLETLRAALAEARHRGLAVTGRRRVATPWAGSLAGTRG